MEGLGLLTWLDLLQAYEAAIRELRLTGDPGVLDYIGRLEKRQAEALAAVEASNAQAFASARAAATGARAIV